MPPAAPEPLPPPWAKPQGSEPPDGPPLTPPDISPPASEEPEPVTPVRTWQSWLNHALRVTQHDSQHNSQHDFHPNGWTWV